MRALGAVALAALAACTSAPSALPTPTPTAEPGVLSVTALLDLSGPRSQVGAQQRNALQLWLDQQGRGGAVRLDPVDVAGSEGRVLIELRRAATETHADAVIIGAAVTGDDTLGRAIDIAGLPVLLLQPLGADPAGRPGGAWTFALAPSIAQLAALHIEDALRRDVLVPSILLADRRERIDPMAAALNAEAERRGLGTLTRIELASDGTVPPVVRSSLSVLKSVHCLAPIAVCSTVAREARGSGSPALVYLPFAASPGKQLRDDRDLAARAAWASSAALPPSALAREYAARHGARPDIHAALAHDAMSLIGRAAQRSGPDDRGALRDGIEGITMPLIANAYSFRADRRIGWAGGSLAYMRWDGTGAAVAPLFGTVAPTPTPSPTPARTATPTPAPTSSP